MQFLNIVKEDILNKIIFDNWTDLASYSYYSVFVIKKLYHFLEKS